MVNRARSSLLHNGIQNDCDGSRQNMRINLKNYKSLNRKIKGMTHSIAHIALKKFMYDYRIFNKNVLLLKCRKWNVEYLGSSLLSTTTLL